MAKPDILIVDGHAFSWQRIVELRKQQLEAWNAEQCRQHALFKLTEDCRPATERTAAGRYREPTHFSMLMEPPSGKGAAGS